MSEIKSVVEGNLTRIEKELTLEYIKVGSDLELLLEGQKIQQKELRLGFIGLAKQNSELLELNKKLNRQLDKTLEELNVLKKEREEKAARKKARAHRKRLPKRQPMTSIIYQRLIEEAEGPSYIQVRLRIAICLLAVTGVRINELLGLKVNQLETLLKLHWIGIDRSKRGPTSHKAFLTREGKKLVEERKKDFEFLFLMKKPESYVFTSELNHYRMLSRETITRDVNKVMHSVSKSLTDQPNITSHSFRVGYISQLWKDTKDLEFVKQSIGHRKMDTTSSYVEKLSDQERQERTEMY